MRGLIIHYLFGLHLWAEIGFALIAVLCLGVIAWSLRNG